MSEQAAEQQEQLAQEAQPSPASALRLEMHEAQAYIDELTAELNECNAVRRLQSVKLRGLTVENGQLTAALEAATAEIEKLKKRRK